MRKLLITLLLGTVCAIANAQHYHHHFRPHYHGHWNWVAPLVIGGVAGAVIMRETSTPPVVAQPQPPVAYSCPPPYQPFFTRTVVTDQYGRSSTVDQFAGCR